MTLEIIDSKYSELKKNIPDLIIIILSAEYPLRIGEICLRLRSNFNIKPTFQGVRKNLNNMVEKKILELKDKLYSINKNYILDVKRILDIMLKNYFSGEMPKKSVTWSKISEKPTTYEFESLIKTDQICNEIILDWANNIKDDDDRRFFFQTPHYWYVFGQLGVESGILDELKTLGVDAHYLAEGCTKLDRWTKKFYDTHRIKYVIDRKPDNSKTTIGVFGDFIVQYDYPAEIYQIIDGFYKNTTKLESMNFSNIAKALKMKTPITLIVMKNKTIASKLKQEMMEKFKK